MTQDDGTVGLVNAVIYVFLLSPLVPLGLAWKRSLEVAFQSPRNANEVLAGILLLFVTLSHGWLLLGLVNKDFVGPDYSNRLFATIDVNFLAVAGILVLGWSVPSRIRLLLAWACGLVALCWGYMGAINSVV